MNVQDLMINGLVSRLDLIKIASTMFDGKTVSRDINGYTMTVASFDDLPDACQQFILKALAFSTVVNVLDDMPVEDDDLYTQEDIDAHGTADRDEVVEEFDDYNEDRDFRE